MQWIWASQQIGWDLYSFTAQWQWSTTFVTDETRPAQPGDRLYMRTNFPYKPFEVSEATERIVDNFMELARHDVNPSKIWTYRDESYGHTLALLVGGGNLACVLFLAKS